MSAPRYYTKASRAARNRRRHSIASALYSKAYDPRDFGSVDPKFDRCNPQTVSRDYLRAEGRL